MSQPTTTGETRANLAGHEPSLHTVEMVCDRLAELGVAVGPDTARDLVRAVLTAEAPRVDARLREALDTALETIRTATQAAMGVLKTTSPTAAPRPRPSESSPGQASVGRARPVPPEPRRPQARRPSGEQPQAPPRREPPRPRDDFDEGERRPVFRRPGRGR